MITHPLLPGIDFEAPPRLVPAHVDYLYAELASIREEAEAGDTASSRCLQGALIELALERRIQTDWVGIAGRFLEHRGEPTAYSEAFAQRLYKFAQWNGAPVHAVYYRWWIERVCGVDRSRDYADIIDRFVQPSGWIYNPEVSPTGIRTRMKSELLLSMAMGCEILKTAGRMEPHEDSLQATIADQPMFPFLSAESFRLTALERLDSVALRPVGGEALLSSNHAERGYCDFALDAKLDDYMGTRKRTGRDAVLASPLAALHARHIARGLASEQAVVERVRDYAAFLTANPLSIPAFTIRDVDIPFGTGLSPVEVLAAGALNEI